MIVSSYTVPAMVGSSHIKEKTTNLAVSISVLPTFMISFTIAYLLNPPYANLGPKANFVYGPLTVVLVIAA